MECNRSAIRKYRGNGNFKDNRTGWLLLGTPETLEKDNEKTVINHQFEAKYERASLGDGKVKLRVKTKTTRAAELQRRFSSQHRQVCTNRLHWCNDIF